MSYQQILNLADINSVSDDPLTYCVPDILNSQFLHGAQGRTFGKYNRQCSEYMSSRCASNWDNICETGSTNTNDYYPDMSNISGCGRVSAGDLLVRDTAFKKYLFDARNCNVQCEVFDPTVADSPSICYITSGPCAIGSNPADSCGILNGNKVQMVSTGCVSGNCTLEYGLTDEQIRNLDNDPVMNKLLSNPSLGSDLLAAIYQHMSSRGTLSKLKNTNLGRFYQINGYQL